MRVRFVDGWIRLVIMLALGFWQLGQGPPYSCAQLKGGVSSNQQLDTSDIHVSQLVNDIDHTVGIVGNAIRRGPVYENPVNADFAEFSAELKAGSSLAQQYSPCVQQYKNAYPHYLKAADLMEEYTRIRLTASAATLKSINQQMGAESNTGAGFFTAARKCSFQVGQHAEVPICPGNAKPDQNSLGEWLCPPAYAGDPLILKGRVEQNQASGNATEQPSGNSYPYGQKLQPPAANQKQFLVGSGKASFVYQGRRKTVILNVRFPTQKILGKNSAKESKPDGVIKQSSGYVSQENGSYFYTAENVECIDGQVYALISPVRIPLRPE